MSKKRDIIRIGDEVEIINPIFVKRVGYPLSIEDIEKELEVEHGAEIRDFLRKIGVCKTLPYDIFDSNDNKPHIPVKILNEMARIILRSRGFGGDERSLHIEEKPEVKGKRCRIIGRKVVKTGIHIAGRTYHSYDGDTDYDPPYLADEKTHLLFFVDEITRRSIFPEVYAWKVESGIGWIEAINLKKVTKIKENDDEW